MKKYFVWFVVIALAVAAGVWLASWLAERNKAQEVANRCDAWENRPRIGFQPNLEIAPAA